MGKEGKSGEMEQCSKDNLGMERNMEKGNLDGLMEAVTRATLIITKSVVKAFTLGRIVGPTKEIGLTIRWTDSASSPGPMVKCIKANTRMIISMGMGSSFGRMGRGTKECGEKESNTGEE